MSSSCTYSKKTNRIHKHCLRIIYQEKQASFERQLEKDNSVSIHHRNLQSRTVKIYKIRNSLSPILIQELFMLNNEYLYNLRYLHQFETSSVNTTYHGCVSKDGKCQSF